MLNEQDHLLGRFLEFSIQTPNIIESLGFYKLLGFQELQVGEVWSHKYAVVSDGVLNIGLHDGKFDSPALTFVHQDVARQAVCEVLCMLADCLVSLLARYLEWISETLDEDLVATGTVSQRRHHQH